MPSIIYSARMTSLEWQAQRHGLNTAGVERLRTILEQTIARGHRDEDYSALFESIDPID